MNDVLEGTVLIIGVLSIVLVGLVLYLISLIMRVEVALYRLRRLLSLEVPRDHNGRPLKERSWK